ncbi:MAG TPA: sigma 54-interacting transcriptional regulator [Myxococcota bacterium]|mgnify:FL=1|nr:sigma 54-interacting transcriptional regulator [Myxococcota bacterium]HOC98786.1 sigma 54-interacting transcriptional regulator [Myxococcota bacterium]HOH77612.1 sigma 54-interacting transcriptional regulator [Myxococcota bacterium]
MASETRTVILDVPVEDVTLNKFLLKVVDGPDRGQSRTFQKRQVTIGTDRSCDFQLSDPTVSRIHAMIEFGPAGFRLKDDGSKNGVFAGDLRVFEAILTDGIEFLVGKTRIAFRRSTETVSIQIATAGRFGSMLGESIEMREVFAIIKKAAPTDTNVLIQGESGTGKELVAQALHQSSNRARGPFVVFDCSAVPAELIESELFGHVKGAFTGAVRDRVGAIGEAEGGTLFLDEIGELPIDLQPKLLRVLESREVRQVGGTGTRKVNFRLVAATNRFLEQETAAGTFRADLFYRLSVITISLPALRRRPQDIPALVNHFLDEIATREGGARVRLSWETMERLKLHPWPGNVRELKNFVERSVILSGALAGTPRALDLPPPLTGPVNVGGPDGIALDLDAPFKQEKDRIVDEFQRRYFTRLLRQTDGNISKTARLAGIHRKTLEYLLKNLDIDWQAEG